MRRWPVDRATLEATGTITDDDERGVTVESDLSDGERG